MYNTIRRIFNVATYGFLNMEVIGEENIPEKGPFIVACNHASNFDPPLLGTAMRHHLIHFMAKEELFRNPVMGWFLRYVHTFPVHRGRIDRKAVMESFKVLKMVRFWGFSRKGSGLEAVSSAPFMKALPASPSRPRFPFCRQLSSIRNFCRKDGARSSHFWKTDHGSGRKSLGSRRSHGLFRRNSRFYRGYAKSV